MHNGAERRKYKRIENPYTARFKIRPNEGLKKVSPYWDIVAVKNLSAGGMLFTCKKDLGIGSVLDLNIDVPRSILIINCVGKVIRIDKLRSTSMYGIAIKFVDIGEQERKAIKTAVEEDVKLKQLVEQFDSHT